MKYGIIVGGTVSNIIECDDAFAGTLISEGHHVIQVPDEICIGDIYDAGKFGKPTQPTPVADEPKRKISNLAFTNRFTDEEAIKIDLASVGKTVEAASIRRYLKKVDLASFIDLDDESTRNGVQALEALGLIGTGRAFQILDFPIEPKEAV